MRLRVRIASCSNGLPGRRPPRRLRAPTADEHRRAASWRTIGGSLTDGGILFPPPLDVFVQRRRATPLLDDVAVGVPRLRWKRMPPSVRLPPKIGRAHV